MKASLLTVRIGIGKVRQVSGCPKVILERCLSKGTAMKFEENSFICMQMV